MRFFVAVAILLAVATAVAVAEEASVQQCGGGPCSASNPAYVRPSIVNSLYQANCTCPPPPSACACSTHTHSTSTSTSTSTGALKVNTSSPSIAAAAVQTAQQVAKQGGSMLAQERAAQVIAEVYEVMSEGLFKTASESMKNQIVTQLTSDIVQNTLEADRNGLLSSSYSKHSPAHLEHLIQAATKSVETAIAQRKLLNDKFLATMEKQMQQSEQETSQKLAKIEAEKNRILEEARQSSHQIQEKAKEEASSQVEKARNQATKLAASARQEADKKIVTARKRAEQALKKKREWATKDIAEQRKLVEKRRAEMRARRSALKTKAQQAGKEAAALVRGNAAKSRAYSKAYQHAIQHGRQLEHQEKAKFKIAIVARRRESRRREGMAKKRVLKRHRREVAAKHKRESGRKRQRRDARRRRAQKRAARRRRRALRVQALRARRRQSQKKRRTLRQQRQKKVEGRHKKWLTARLKRQQKLQAQQQKLQDRINKRRQQRDLRRRQYQAKLGSLRTLEAQEKKKLVVLTAFEKKKGKRLVWASDYINRLNRLIKIQSWKRKYFLRLFNQIASSWQFQRATWRHPLFCDLINRKRSVRLHAIYIGRKISLEKHRITQLQQFMALIRKASGEARFVYLTKTDRGRDTKLQKRLLIIKKRALRNRSSFSKRCTRQVQLKRKAAGLTLSPTSTASTFYKKQSSWDRRIRNERRKLKVKAKRAKQAKSSKRLKRVIREDRRELQHDRVVMNRQQRRLRQMEDAARNSARKHKFDKRRLNRRIDQLVRKIRSLKRNFGVRIRRVKRRDNAKIRSLQREEETMARVATKKFNQLKRAGRRQERRSKRLKRTLGKSKSRLSSMKKKTKRSRRHMSKKFKRRLRERRRKDRKRRNAAARRRRKSRRGRRRRGSKRRRRGSKRGKRGRRRRGSKRRRRQRRRRGSKRGKRGRRRRGSKRSRRGRRGRGRRRRQRRRRASSKKARRRKARLTGRQRRERRRKDRRRKRIEKRKKRVERRKKRRDKRIAKRKERKQKYENKKRKALKDKESKEKAVRAERLKKAADAVRAKLRERAEKAAERKQKIKEKERKFKNREREGTSFTLTNGWRWIGGSYEKPVVRIDGSLCVVSGVVTNSAWQPSVGQLPPKCRPIDGQRIFTLLYNDQVVRVDVTASGQIHINFAPAAVGGWLSLSGMSFTISDSSSVPMDLGSGWRPYGHGYAPPAMHIANGICLLQGLAAGGWGQFSKMPGVCWPTDGRALFGANNHQKNTRWDIVRTGEMIHSGGQTWHGWSSMDGVLWKGRDLDGTDIEMRPGFVNYAHDYRPAKWVRAGRICLLSGLISKQTQSNILAILPEECRPLRRIILSGPTFNQEKLRLDIRPNGEIILAGRWYGWDWFSLEGAHFVADGIPGKDELKDSRQSEKDMEKRAEAQLKDYMEKNPKFATAYRLAKGTALKLAEGWKTYGRDYIVPSWRIVDGVCFLSGVAKWKSGTTIAVLPEGCRPEARVIFNVIKGNGVARVDITNDGSILLVHQGTYPPWLSLDGVFFNIQTEKLPGFDLQNGWIAYQHGYRFPQANEHTINEKKFCIISGLIRNSGHHHLANVPSECMPSDGRLIFATNNHNFATRVDVLTNGQIHNSAHGYHGWRNMDNMLWSPSGGAAIKLASGWRNYGHGYRNAKLAKVGQLCMLSGLITHGDWSSGFIMRLPPSCRPQKRLIFVSNIHENIARVDVLPDGHVMWISNLSPHRWLSLSNIVFIASPHVAGIGANPYERTIPCKEFWQAKDGKCFATHDKKDGADDSACNPFLGECRVKCCVTKEITCGTFFTTDNGGRCPAGFRNVAQHQHMKCHNKFQNEADSCVRRCCQYIAPGQGGKCTSWGDPHDISFDGVHFDCRHTGEFVMMNHEKADEEIHAERMKNPRRDIAAVPAFNVGFGWRSQRDVLTLQLLKPHWEIFRLALRFNGKLIPWPEKKISYGDFELQPNGPGVPGPFSNANDPGFHHTFLGVLNRRTGTTANVHFRYIGYHQRYLDMHITLPQPHMSTWGICGTWDGNRQNDLIQGNDKSKPCGWHDSDRCCDSYIVKKAKSFFNNPPKKNLKGAAPKLEDICKTSEKLAEAKSFCDRRPKKYQAPCMLEMCAGASAAFMKKELNLIRKGHE